MKNNCHNYSNLALCQILFYVHPKIMVLDLGTKYKENLASHRGGIRTDTLTGGLTVEPEEFLYCLIPLFRSGE